MTTKDTEENEDLKTIEHITESSPAFEADINPITVLEMLDQHIETLGGKVDEKATLRIESELQSLEIVTMTHGDTSWWITEPFVLHQYEMKRTMAKRISHLLKTGGEWKKERVKKDNLEVKSRIGLPVEIGIHPEAETAIQNGEISALLLSVMGLRNTIEAMLKDGAASCGVFRKPEGVIQMNRLRAWLVENENRGAWEMKDQLSVTSLYDIAKSATFTTD